MSRKQAVIYEYRVVWRREAWSAGRMATKRCRSRGPLFVFVEKLRRGDEELSPVVELSVSRRPVAPWEPVELGDLDPPAGSHRRRV